MQRRLMKLDDKWRLDERIRYIDMMICISKNPDDNTSISHCRVVCCDPRSKTTKVLQRTFLLLPICLNPPKSSLN